VILPVVLAVAAAGGVPAAPSASVATATVTVQVALCPKERFLADTCLYEASAPAQAGVTTVTFPAIPAGDYAAQAFHDENANGKMDRIMGVVPKEGFGFSRDAKVRFAPPKWDEAVFTHEAKPQVLQFSLRYMMGAK
jgi:uncharacterized protein (DUF2141 family)